MSWYSTHSRPSVTSLAVALGFSILLSTAMAPGGAATDASTEIAPGDLSQGDRFGKTIAKDGDVLLVSAPFTDDSEKDQGRVYLFTQTDGAWQQAASLQASNPGETALFGWSLAVDGDTLLVGAPRADGGALNEGAAYVFTRSGGDVVQQARLNASDAQVDDRFGRAVALDGDTAVVSAPMEEASGWDRGAAYVFQRSEGNWSQSTKLVADQASDRDLFGDALALEQDTLLVAAPREDGMAKDQGVVHAFTRSDGWVHEARLVAESPEEGARFGQALALDGDRALVGAPFADGDGRDQGAAYVFERSTGWSQQARLTSPQPEDGSLFGSALALEGSSLAVGAPRAAEGGDQRGLAYRGAHADGSWQLASPVAPSTAEDRERLGTAVALDGEAAIVGALGRGPGGAVLVVSDSAPRAGFDVSPSQPLEGETVSFSDRSVDDGSIAGHSWDFGEGNHSEQASPSHAFRAGEHKVCLTVEDRSGHTDEACRTLTVRNASSSSSTEEANRTQGSSEETATNGTGTPMSADEGLQAAFEVQPDEPSAGTRVTFQDRSQAPESSISAYEWEFGDGAASTETSPTHTFATNGTYQVCLTIQDSEERSSTACQTVEVQASSASTVPGPGAVSLLFASVMAGVLSTRNRSDASSNSGLGPEAKDK